MSNLKQINLANLQWLHDHEENQVPWATAASNRLRGIAASADVASLFRTFSNELGTPKILKCPADRQRKQVADFTKLKDANISYFVRLDPGPLGPEAVGSDRPGPRIRSCSATATFRVDFFSATASWNLSG